MKEGPDFFSTDENKKKTYLTAGCSFSIFKISES